MVCFFCFFFFFFFFKQKTAYEITYGDWSSDVCSSDLGAAGERRLLEAAGDRADRGLRDPGLRDHRRGDAGDPADRGDAALHQLRRQLDRRQLRAAGAAAAGLRSGAARGRRLAGPDGDDGDGGVNRQIVKLFAFIVVLFGVLVGFTSYWSVFDAKALKEKEANR